MEGALVILAAMVVVGVLLFTTDKMYFSHHHHQASRETKENETPEEASQGELPSSVNEAAGEVCCGMHLVCEKTSLSVVSDEVIYYDDEELDRFKGRLPESYTSSETEEFRDVLMTLLPEDVAGWGRSITLRGIELPSEVKDEFLMLVAEIREKQ